MLKIGSTQVGIIWCLYSVSHCTFGAQNPSHKDNDASSATRIVSMASQTCQDSTWEIHAKQQGQIQSMQTQIASAS
eukprot:m.158094 g.158094  ORF g.158094 m.158094 type:complete len:76 (-) comp16459_c0_seq16:1983-2210(-)